MLEYGEWVIEWSLEFLKCGKENEVCRMDSGVWSIQYKECRMECGKWNKKNRE